MQQFNVRFNEGTTPAVRDATLTLMPDYWLINFTGDLDQIRSVRWELKKIRTEQGFTNLAIFRYHEFSEQTIECRDENLPRILRETYPEITFFKKKVSNTILGSPLSLLGLILFLLAMLAAAYFLVLPFAARKIAARIPRQMEVRLGETLFENVTSAYKKDEISSKKINHFAKAIDFKTDYPISITVVKNEETNAFALPGGHIVVFDGILKKMKTKEELAALLAHEASHIHYQHSLRSLFRSMGGYLFISFIFSDITGIAAIVAENSNMLLNLTYSRELETEADENAARIFQSQGISMKGLVDLFKILENGEEKAGQSSLLSTHPLTEERLRQAQVWAREQTGIIDQSELQKRWIMLEADK